MLKLEGLKLAPEEKEAALHRKAARLLGQSPLWASLPLLEIALPLMHLYVRVYRLFRGQKDYTFRLDNKH